MLVRTLGLIDDGVCCDFFACPGPDARPEPMASCARATAAYELRNYLERHGGWCKAHGQHLDRCEPGTIAKYTTATICEPVVRNARGKRIK